MLLLDKVALIVLSSGSLGHLQDLLDADLAHPLLDAVKWLQANRSLEIILLLLPTLWPRFVLWNLRQNDLSSCPQVSQAFLDLDTYCTL